MQDRLASVLQAKGAKVHSVGPRESVMSAVRSMNEEKVGCMLVKDGDTVVGIFTERDVLTRVVASQKDPQTTRVEEVMTREPIAIGPQTTVEEAMAVITEKRCRHLPVIENDRLVGMVSSGDLTRWVSRHQEHHIRDLVNYITGQYPA